MKLFNIITKTRWLVTIMLLIVLAVPNAWGTAASLPFSYDGGKSGTTGMTCSGLGTDYGSSPKMKFDGAGDYVLIEISSTPDKLGYKIKGNPSSGSSVTGMSFVISECATESGTYTTVQSYTSLSNSATTVSNIQLSSSTRFIKFTYVTKGNGNVALGAISISAGAAKTCVLFNHTFRPTTVYHSVV